MQGYLTDPPSAAQPAIDLSGISTRITGVDQINKTASVRVENLQGVTVVDGTLDSLTLRRGAGAGVDVLNMSVYAFQDVPESTSAGSTVVTVTATSGTVTEVRELALTVDCTGPVFTEGPTVTSEPVDQTTRDATVAFVASDALSGLDASKTRYLVNSPDASATFAEGAGAVFTGLSRGFEYTFKVVVEDVAGNRSEATVGLVADPYVPSAAPVPDTSNVSITYTDVDPNGTSVKMNWTGFDPAELDDTGKYRMTFEGAELITDNLFAVLNTTPSTAYTTAAGTAPKLQAKNADGVYSDVVAEDFTTPATPATPPAAPGVPSVQDDAYWYGTTGGSLARPRMAYQTATNGFVVLYEETSKLDGVPGGSGEYIRLQLYLPDKTYFDNYGFFDSDASHAGWTLTTPDPSSWPQTEIEWARQRFLDILAQENMSYKGDSS